MSTHHTPWRRALPIASYYDSFVNRTGPDRIANLDITGRLALQAIGDNAALSRLCGWLDRSAGVIIHEYMQRWWKCGVGSRSLPVS
jgi:hypothetical protein